MSSDVLVIKDGELNGRISLVFKYGKDETNYMNVKKFYKNF